MSFVKPLCITAVIATISVTASNVSARSSYGFSINTGPMFAPAPVFVAPPPPPPVIYQPAYPVYPVPYYRPGPSFSFSYFGR